GGGEEQEETHQGREDERRLEHDDGGCEVTVCAAAAKIVLGIGEQDDDGDAKEPQEDSSVGGQQRVCRSVVVGGQGSAVRGTLNLPDRPQTGRWYLTARAACEAAPGTARHKQRSLRRSTEGADVPTTSAASEDEGVPGTGGGVPSA
ncbi:unnamed protein product, partial [Ectocarpus sp. 12 AP-2014]